MALASTQPYIPKYGQQSCDSTMKDSVQRPLVSVICDIFNHEKYLRRCFDGFIMQETTFPFEVLVHDDASSDSSQDIINEYTERYPHIFKPVFQSENQYSKGVSIWMNFQIPRVSGKYIAFCEGDDYWTSPYKLQKQVDFLDKEPQYSMCFHSAEKKYECDGVSWINCENIEDKDYNATEIFVNWTIPTASVVCRKEALEFYSSLKGKKNIQNYDIFVFLSCAMVGQIRGMHDKMSVYRIQENSVSHVSPVRAIDFLNRLKNTRLLYAKREPIKFKLILWYGICRSYRYRYIDAGIYRKWFYMCVRDFIELFFIPNRYF